MISISSISALLPRFGHGIVLMRIEILHGADHGERQTLQLPGILAVLARRPEAPLLEFHPELVQQWKRRMAVATLETMFP
jgi:hypothetical protein